MTTPSDIEASQNRQDEGIRKEFRNVYQRFDEMDERFEEVDECFNRMDERFNKIDERFNKVDERFNKVDERFDKLEALMMNARATSSWHDIIPLSMVDPLAEPGSPYQTPPNFPTKVAKFWHLQRPRNRKNYHC